MGRAFGSAWGNRGHVQQSDYLVMPDNSLGELENPSFPIYTKQQVANANVSIFPKTLFSFVPLRIRESTRRQKKAVSYVQIKFRLARFFPHSWFVFMRLFEDMLRWHERLFLERKASEDCFHIHMLLNIFAERKQINIQIFNKLFPNKK